MIFFGSGAQDFADFRLSVIKDPLQCFSYKQAVEKAAEDTVWDCIMDAVDKPDAFWRRREFVIMVPDPVRANSLFIDKRFLLTKMLKSLASRLRGNDGPDDFLRA